MYLCKRPGRVNWKVVGILTAVACVLCGGAILGHYAQKRASANQALREGEAAYARGDWPEASRALWRYLQKYPDSPPILAKYAHAQAQVRPLDGGAIQSIIAAYRRLVRFEPDNEEAYDQLAKLYAGVRDYDNLAYIARMRLKRLPDDLKASAWLGRALAVQHKPDQVREVLVPAVEKWRAAPQRFPEFVDACSLLSEVAALSASNEGYDEAQRWLDLAVEYSPEAPEALINRARFRRTLSGQPQQNREALLAGARADLERADALQPEDPRQRLILSDEWMRHGRLDRAGAELEAIRDVKPEVIRKYFFDPTDWRIAVYLQSAELSLRRGKIADGARMSDELLSELNDKAQRLPALPTAVRTYVAADRVADAERCLREYQENKHLGLTTVQSEDTPGLLEALVARSQDEPYRVIELLEPIAARSPTNVAAWRLLAEAYSQTEQVRRSIRAIRQYMSVQPEDVEMARMLMRNYVRQQDWSRAVAAARTVESLVPNDTEARLLQVEDALNRAVAGAPDQRATRLEAVGKQLDELAKAHPQLPEIWTLRAAVAANLGDVQRAEEEMRQAEGHGLDPVRLQLHRSRLYLSLREPDKAIEALKEACKPTTTEAAPWLDLSDLERARGQIAKARETLRDALHAVRGEAALRDVRTKLAVLEIIQGDHQAGIEMLQEMATRDPRNLRVRTMLLAVPAIQKDPAASARLVQEMRQVEGERGLTWRLWQGTVLLAQPDWRTKQHEVAPLLQRCLDADPGWKTPALLLGRLYEQVGNADRAEAVYRNVLAADPGALEVADRLLELLQRQGRLSQANDVLTNLDATDIALNSRRTLVAMETGNLDQAIDDLKVRASHDPQDVQSRVLLAQLTYRRSRDVEQSLRILGEADAISPGSIAVTMGRVVILNAEGRQDEAIVQLDALVAAKDSYESHQLRGSYLASIGRIDQAERDYVRLAELPGDGTGYLTLGAFYAQTRRLDQAVKTWRDGIKRYPENLALQRSVMKGLMQRGSATDFSEAVGILTALEARLPSDPELLTIRASLLISEGTEESIAKAEKMLEQAVELAPTYSDAHLGLITVALRRHDYHTARKRAVLAMGTNVNDMRLLAVRGQAELALGNYVMARDLANLILKDNPADPQARDLLVQAAVATRNERDLQTAHILVNDQLARNRADLQLQLTHALVTSSLGQTDEAVASLEEYIAGEVGGKSVEAIVSLADLYQSKGNMARADELLRKAAAMQPDGPAVVRGRVNWLAAQQRYGQIVELMQGYLASPSVDADVVVGAASALAAAQGQTADRELGEAALKLFEAAIRISSDPLAARSGYASLAYQLRRIDEAEQAYRTILAATPNNIQALNDLAWLLCKDRRQSEQALELADRAVRLASDNIHVRDTRAEVLASLPGRLPDARREFETCVELAPPDSPARARELLKLARVLAAMDNAKQASQRVEEARRIDQQQNVFTQAEREEMTQLAAAQPGERQAVQQAGSAALPGMGGSGGAGER